MQPLQLSCYLPTDVVPNLTNGNSAQRSADVFSWQEFFALNWPNKPGKRGEAEDRAPITGLGPRVWETWKESYEVFLPDGSAPGLWEAGEVNACRSGKRLVRTQKIDDMGIDSVSQAAGAVAEPPPLLTDRAGRLVRYEIRMNRVLFDYVVANKLYNGLTQAKFGPVDLPNGSVLVKAAWREVGSAEEERRFYVAAACVCDGGVNGPAVNCRERRMALVGMHIAQRTPSAPQWIWSTFEHRDNVPGSGGRAPFSFFDPSCRDCKPNQQTVAGTPAQLSRVWAIPGAEPDCSRPNESVDSVQRLNADVAEALRRRESTFQNYELIGTQRPLPPAGNRPTTVFAATPERLANTTMESFVQGTSSCVGCHSTARTSDPNRFASSHFAFILNNAKPVPPVTTVLQLPTSPEDAWQKEHWREIERGRRLATHTYEELKPFVPVSRLHCSSCHLGGGTNSTAAWWVDLKYRYPTAPAMEARINLCFENSMNGYPLCKPASEKGPGNCAQNADMQSMVRYMEFLTRVYDQKPLSPTPHGFPAVKTLTGDYCSGQATFVQKCAVCHESDGQGRYTQGYFRPALWGPHSFSKKAGMFGIRELLAQFLSWNMPFGSGGQLTDQEAWDLAAYIDSHSRPGFEAGALPRCLSR